MVAQPVVNVKSHRVFIVRVSEMREVARSHACHSPHCWYFRSISSHFHILVDRSVLGLRLQGSIMADPLLGRYIKVHLRQLDPEAEIIVKPQVKLDGVVQVEDGRDSRRGQISETALT